jgi:hypothetical protein
LHKERSRKFIMASAATASEQAKPCKVYFAGSIRGGRDDADLYGKIVQHMLSLQLVVLTEHVANPQLTAKGEVKGTLRWVKQFAPRIHN